LLGRLYPIPSKLFQLTDLFIGLAGAAGISAAQNIPTAVINIDTHKVDGIFGYEVNSGLHNSFSLQKELSIFLEELFVEGKIVNYEKRPPAISALPDYNIEFDNHMKFISDSKADDKYYTFNFIKLRPAQQVICKITKILGIGWYNILIDNSLARIMWDNFKKIRS